MVCTLIQKINMIYSQADTRGLTDILYWIEYFHILSV